MNVVVLTIVQLLISVNAKLLTKKLKEKNVNSFELNKESITLNEEKHDSGSEYFKFYTKKINTRSSNESTGMPTIMTKYKRTVKPQSVLVKKPIPKFIDTGSEEDYQAKARSPSKYIDSVEHEDEDFNVDDYDFDVNHDEFASRGKPLEPRLKINKHRVKEEPIKMEIQPRPKPILIESKIVLPHKKEKVSNKVVRKAADKMKEEEYDDAFLVTPKTTEKYRSAAKTEIEVSDENYDSSEIENKPLRTARSPSSFGTYFDRIGDKTSAIMSKILSYLPIFPQTFYTPRKLMNDEHIVTPLLEKPVM